MLGGTCIDSTVVEPAPTITLANVVADTAEVAGSGVVDATAVISLSRPDDM